MVADSERGVAAKDVHAIQSIPAVAKILDVVCRMTGMGFAAVARVTGTRWMACSVRDEIAFGLEPGGELAVESTICHEIQGHGKPIVIDDVTCDAQWSAHHTPAQYGFRSYISVPIVLPDGEFFGTLCAIDPKPAKLSSTEALDTFTLFAELIAFHLDVNRRLAMSEAALLDEREASRLREQFIAVLGHDLRNPLGSIATTAAVLTKTALPEPVQGLVERMQNSVKRISGLIDNLMDFARGRLGGGFTLTLVRESLAPALEQVVAELRTNDREIESHFDLPEPVLCDRARIAQLLSNLLSNALTHGARDAPVRTAAFIRDGWLELYVANKGDPIPPATVTRLFAPFSRGEVMPNQSGLGLGLYIASEIARAHGGTLTVQSTAAETRFTLRIPAA